jgi:hypothetical protein
MTFGSELREGVPDWDGAPFAERGRVGEAVGEIAEQDDPTIDLR